MNKQNKQKGFTLVELVIVIAVIAILAGVLIPTFSGIVEKANKSAALQNCKNTYQEATLAIVNTDVDLEGKILESKGYYYEINNGTLTLKDMPENEKKEYKYYCELSNDVKLWDKTSGAKIDEYKPDDSRIIYMPYFEATYSENKAYSLIVFDEDGNEFYSEKGTAKNTTTHIFFCMYEDNGNANSWDSAATPSNKLKSFKNAADAEGWYSYELTIDGTKNYGVFYYSAK